MIDGLTSYWKIKGEISGLGNGLFGGELPECVLEKGTK